MKIAPVWRPSWTPRAAASAISRRRARRLRRRLRRPSRKCRRRCRAARMIGEKASGVGRVTLEINGRPYVIGCEDGGEAHVRALAARIDEAARQIAPDAGAPGEARLILMAALVVADQLAEAETA